MNMKYDWPLNNALNHYIAENPHITFDSTKPLTIKEPTVDQKPYLWDSWLTHILYVICIYSVFLQ